jgi:hypothetical protein
MKGFDRDLTEIWQEKTGIWVMNPSGAYQKSKEKKRNTKSKEK